jgi:hypothetical protein
MSPTWSPRRKRGAGEIRYGVGRTISNTFNPLLTTDDWGPDFAPSSETPRDFRRIPEYLKQGVGRYVSTTDWLSREAERDTISDSLSTLSVSSVLSHK